MNPDPQVLWEDRFNTKLPTVKEFLFQNWLKEQSQARGRDLSKDLRNYDLRGYFNEAGGAQTDGGHLPDKFKKPNHPTFSDESIYNGTATPDGGEYQGGKWEGDDKSGWTFQPSLNMAATPKAQEELRQYFQEFEPDAVLVMPSPLKTVSDRKPQ